MWMIIKTWLFGNTLRFVGWSAIAASVMVILLGAKQSDRNAERVDQLKKILEIKDAQLRATLDAPRNRAELAHRLRDGKF